MGPLRRFTEGVNALTALVGLAIALLGAGALIVGADAAFGELPLIAQLALFAGAMLLMLALALWIVQRQPRDTQSAASPTPNAGPFAGATFLNSPLNVQITGHMPSGDINVSVASTAVARAGDFDAVLIPPGLLLRRGIEDVLQFQDRAEAVVTRRSGDADPPEC